ncbi:MAG: MBOAT family protein [Proteobacteria bacterium]|nr:MBOAT family protein [Pseudomonadota bacterium]
MNSQFICPKKPMHFNSVEYACLLIGAIACTWLMTWYEKPKLRVILLLTASYIFYASWNPKYLVLIFFSSSLDFTIGRFLARAKSRFQKKALLAGSVVVNLGILCAFKYFNFFTAEVSALLHTFGVEMITPHLDILLPVGISFYTFQTLSYTIDVYREQLEPAKNYFEYLLFVSFFPQLVAGPIVRARTLLPQIARMPKLSAEQGSRAIYRIGIGIVKKIAIADFLGAHIVDPVFSNPEMYSSIEALVGVYAYAFQIYADFSAYSDIAIGSAALLGFEIPENFNAPYRAADLREFWQRWHISLSTWLKDYLYIPLGGSQSSAFRTYVNLMITMLIGGLWHGAANTFIVWGAMHGGALVITRIVQRLNYMKKVPFAVRRAAGVILTFHLVCAAWVFFRAPNFDMAASIFESIASLTVGTANISTPVIIALAAAIFTHWIPIRWTERCHSLFHALPAPIQAAALIAAILLIQRLASTEVEPFIYFQF